MGTEAMYNHTIDWNVSSQPLMGFLCIPEINIWHNDNNNNIHNNHIKEMIMINQQQFSISSKNNQYMSQNALLCDPVTCYEAH